MLSMVKTKQTPTETKLRDEVAKERFLQCLADVNPKSAEGCAQIAFEAAEAFVAERRRRQQS
jgi:hypothetical protein